MLYPVLSILSEVKEKLSTRRIVILEAPPGAGKSTVLPLHLLEESWLGDRKMILLEPRRLAARSVAMRMAELHGETVGQTVGYKVRFDHRVSNATRIEVVTEGILTRYIQNDNALDGVGLLIFDEFHERSLHADLALAFSLQVQQVLRDDLRILIMSATLDGEGLSAILGAPVIRSSGRQHPVAIHYWSMENAPIPVQAAKGIRKALKETQGDVLTFLPGAGEIRRAADLLEKEHLPVVVCPLYGDMNFQSQQQAIMPDAQGRRKVVLATSIAETSLTIEGVSVVVDCGYARVPRFDARSGFTRLETVRVTRDAADQRAGRAGRLGPGSCYRLWSAATQLNLLPARSPEILEADLAALMLELAEWNVQDISELTWVTPPPAGAVNQARSLLQALGALEDNRITARGKKMLRLPTHPRIAHMLLAAAETGDAAPGALALAVDVAALLEERDPVGADRSADLALRVELLRRWRGGERVDADRHLLERIERLARSWRELFNIGVDNSVVSDRETGRCLMAAYPERVARQVDKNGERYKMTNGRTARLPDHDPLQREPWLAIAHVDPGRAEGKIFLAAALDEQDLLPLTVEREVVTWDDEREMVIATLERCMGNVVVSSRPISVIPPEERFRVLAEVIREKGLAFIGWGDAQRSWQARVASLRHWRPSEDWPDVSEPALLKNLDSWLRPFLDNLYKRSEFAKLDFDVILNTILPWSLNTELSRLAPSRLPVPSGSMIRLQYFVDGRPPVMEVRLQEVFGMLETPAVNEGRNKVVMHLLSPGYKPVQVTQDLKSFWSNTYAEVRKELRSRYPKHSWPEDPWNAQAVRGVKRRT